jgi:NAD(P)-dependent dehydrogenase (short-subunit alcohol dehydrogenase family)
MNADNLKVFDLQNKVAIVTGGSKGIGEAVAHLLANRGAKVVVSSRKLIDVELVAKEIRSKGNDAVGIACNAGDPEQCENLITQSVQLFGGIDILINNAATNPVYGPVLECSTELFDKLMNVNVRGPFVLSKLAYPSMKLRGGGNVINISSIAGHTPDQGLGMYSVTKAALNMLTKVLAKEWGPDGIRVNAIAPGLIKTKFSRALWDNSEITDRLMKKIPSGRIGTPEEIAYMVLFLVSEASAYCTGSVFTADGGWTI